MCDDCRVRTSQTFLWGLPDTGLLARGFPRRNCGRGRNILAFRGSGVHMEESIFQPYLGAKTIFRMDREILRPSYIPERLPHRESYIDQLAQILATALKGERPSNILIFGKTGTEDRRGEVHRERVPQGGRLPDGALPLPELRGVRLAEL